MSDESIGGHADIAVRLVGRHMIKVTVGRYWPCRRRRARHTVPLVGRV
jgi:hypothetical protein